MIDSECVDVDVVVVTYNRADLVGTCLRSITAGTSQLRMQVTVIDNSDRDDVMELVRSEFPQVDLIRCEENLGFARACNIAVSRGTGAHVLLLNPDTVVHPGAIDALAEHFARDPGVGLLGGRTLTPDGHLDPSSCWGAISLWSLFCFASGLSWAFKSNRFFDPESLGGWQRDTVREVGVVTGCLLFTSRKVWDRLDGFDEDFFMYAEDADLTWRARLLGYHPSITPLATITHEVGATSPSTASRTVLHNAGLRTLIGKRWGGLLRWVASALFTVGVLLRVLAYATAARISHTAEAKNAIWQEVWRRRDEWRSGYPSSTGGRAPDASGAGGNSRSGPVR